MKTKRAKKVRAIYLVLAMLILCSCNSKPESTLSAVDVYKSTAQTFIDAGDYDAAIRALEEGIEATNDDGLIALLEEVKAAHGAPAGDDGETKSDPTDTQQPGSEPSQEPTSTPEPTPEPTSTPAPTQEPTPAATGRFDNFIGIWQDRDGIPGGEGVYLTVRYADETKQRAYACVSTTLNQYTVELTTEDGETAYGYVTSGGSEPIFAIELYTYEYWLEASIYYGDIGVEEYTQFVVTDPDLLPDFVG